MPNDPKPAKETRAPTPDRQTAQGDPEGSAHGPDVFGVMNPQVGDRVAVRPSPGKAIA